MREDGFITVQFEYKFYTAYFHIEHHTDNFYGSDADGKGGMPRRFIDDILITDILDENQVSLKEVPEELLEEVLEKIKTDW